MHNKVTIVGRLGRDPETRYTQNGTAVTNLAVATSESYKDKEGAKQEKTEWHRVVTWGKQAENVGQYLSKGRMVLVEGRLQTRSYDDKDGVTRYVTEINAGNVTFLPDGGGNGGGNSSGQDPDDGAEDNIPF